MSRLLLSIVLGILFGVGVVLVVNPRPIKKQWADICLGAQLVREYLAGDQGALP